MATSKCEGLRECEALKCKTPHDGGALAKDYVSYV